MFSAILDVVFWNFSTLRNVAVHQRQYLISFIKNIVHELPNELVNDLRVEMLRK